MILLVQKSSAHSPAICPLSRWEMHYNSHNTCGRTLYGHKFFPAGRRMTTVPRKLYFLSWVLLPLSRCGTQLRERVSGLGVPCPSPEQGRGRLDYWALSRGGSAQGGRPFFLAHLSLLSDLCIRRHLDGSGHTAGAEVAISATGAVGRSRLLWRR